MNTLNTRTDCKFNWDDFDVGNLHLDNSQNFFGRKHYKHEKFENKQNNMDDVEELLEESFESNKENKEILNLQDLSDAINCLAAEASAGSSKDSQIKPTKARKSMLPSDLRTIKNMENHTDAHCDNKEAEQNSEYNINTDHAYSKASAEIATTTTIKVEEPDKKNLLLEWSSHPVFKAPQRPKSANGCSAPPKAYIFKDIYQQKRAEALRKREDEERKSREFHSRPMPNFKACHNKKIQRPVAHVVTCPKTPVTVKTWRNKLEIRKQKQEEESQKQKVFQKSKPRSVAYLREEPFKPKLPDPVVVEQKPFRLGTEHRLQLRREFNAAVQRAHEEQKRLGEEQCRKQEIAILKEIRKMTQFKARPNPFK